jgi:hypothetical protein
MAARKKAEDQEDQVQAEEQAADERAVEDRADGDIQVQVDSGEPASEADTSADDYVVTEDHEGRPVAESFVGEKFSTLDHDEDDPEVPLPTPGGPGDEPPLNRVEKAEVLAQVTKPEVTSQNPEAYSVEELNHRFTHIPPEGFVERKFPVKQ